MLDWIMMVVLEMVRSKLKTCFRDKGTKFDDALDVENKGKQMIKCRPSI
jgi:hypothetical protein